VGIKGGKRNERGEERKKEGREEGMEGREGLPLHLPPSLLPSLPSRIHKSFQKSASMNFS